MEAVRIENLTFAYPDSDILLSDVSLKLETGAFALVVGNTGSGKTTLLRSIKPELAPSGKRTGSTSVFGQETSMLDPHASATLIGYVSQSPENQIVCDTVWHELAFGLENLATAPETMRRRVAEIAHFFGIEPWMHAETASLSGGQKQAVTLASILVMQPKLVLLDEPTAQLDPVAEKNFLHALFRINKELGITIIMATHSPEAVKDYATCAFHLENGQLSQVRLQDFIYEEKAAGDSKETCNNEGVCDGSEVAGSKNAGDGSEVAASKETGDTPRIYDSREAAGSSAGKGTVHDKKKQTEVHLQVQKPFEESRKSAIEVRDLYFRYTRESEWVLRGADIAIAEQSIHAIVGGNGSGKSTLLKAVAGVLKPLRGQVHNTKLSAQAMLPQDPKMLFVCDSVEEELLEWQNRCGYSTEEVQAIMQRFHLEEQAAQHPYDLSGGQQQKLAFAKILLVAPQLLLLDEPTKGLDTQSKLELFATLKALQQEGATIVIASHDLAFVSQVANTTSMLFDGQIVATETTKEFFQNNLFYKPTPNAFLQEIKKASIPNTSSKKAREEAVSNELPQEVKDKLASGALLQETEDKLIPDVLPRVAKDRLIPDIPLRVAKDKLIPDVLPQEAKDRVPTERPIT